MNRRRRSLDAIQIENLTLRVHLVRDVKYRNNLLLSCAKIPVQDFCRDRFCDSGIIEDDVRVS